MRITPLLYCKASLVIAIILVSGCALFVDLFRSVELSENRHFPRQPAFSIQPNGRYENAGLDFNAVYYRSHESRGRPTGVVYTTYNYWRFWPNGCAMIKFGPELPRREEAEDFTRAYVGYYQVSNSEIVIQLYVPYCDVWRYGTIYGHVESNSITIAHETIRHIEMTVREVYLKHPLGNLRRQPDW